MQDSTRVADPSGTTATTARGPYRKGVERRQQILDSTLAVFDERGFEGTSLRSIAESVGLTHNAVRRYFGSLEELLLEVLQHGDRRAWTDFTAERGGARFASRSAEVVTRTPGLMALFNGMVARAVETGNERSREFFVERYERTRRQVVAVLEQGRRQGTVRADIPLDVTASLLVAAMDGLSTQWLLDHEIDPRVAMALFDDLISPASR